MKRLISFRKLKISSGLEFLRRFFKLFVLQCFGRICLNLSQFMRMCLTVRGTLHVRHTGESSPFFLMLTMKYTGHWPRG